ncbi:MAG: chorismate-binding protein [Acidimicrobiales bacterium]|nr:chorismate-binding protein [Acidimicrobiales bacterium]
MTGPAARIDDTSAGGSGSFRLEPVERVVEARRPGEVRAALEAVEAAARSGRWAVGFVAYEASTGLDPSLTVVEADPAGVPLAWFAIGCRVDGPAGGAAASPGHVVGRWAISMSAARHLDEVAAIRERLAAGDTYQVNLTARLEASWRGDAEGLYHELLAAQRRALGAYADTGDHAVVCASPELFFSLAGGCLVCRPMKGTRARGRWVGEDEAAGRALAASEKDRAENVIVVDLVRNDLGRIARTGTVRVLSLFDLERYPTVWQLTSTIQAEPRNGVGLVDVFAALFPSGSVTGAPKPSTTRIIAAGERSPRGVYCGAAGWVGPPLRPGALPEARFAVAIRTATVDRRRACVTYGAGGAITWDSEPAAEYDELLAKARVLSLPFRPAGLVETLRFEPGAGLVNLERHLARVAASARYWEVPVDADRTRDGLARAVAGQDQPALVRLVLAASGVIQVGCRPVPTAPEGPVRLALASEPVSSADVRLFHKTTDRGGYERRRGQHPEADDVLLVNEHGHVTESTIANVVVLLDGRWVTPPLGDGCLPGVGRALLLEAGDVVEASVPLADLHRASALALVSSARGWRPAVLCTETARFRRSGCTEPPAVTGGGDGRSARPGEGPGRSSTPPPPPRTPRRSR